jgi:hypothetical protein
VWLWKPVLEAVWRALEGALQRGLALLAYLGGAAGVHALGCHHGDAGMPVLLVDQEENGAQWARASASEPKRAGKPCRYFRVLNCASEYGLSSET